MFSVFFEGINNYGATSIIDRFVSSKGMIVGHVGLTQQQVDNSQRIFLNTAAGSTFYQPWYTSLQRCAWLF